MENCTENINYDVTILGQGLSGLALAYYLHHSTIPVKKVLLLDSICKIKSDRTWCFWNFSFENLRDYDWSKLKFEDEVSTIYSCIDNQYSMLRSESYNRYIKDIITNDSRFELIYHEVFSIDLEKSYFKIKTKKNTYTSKYVFNSIIIFSGNQHIFNNSIKQHFYGFFIKVSEALFDPDTATLMDFATPQKNQTRFFYLLPLSETEALVEFTVFSSQLLPFSEYREELHTYLEARLGIASYEVTEEEYGVIPMTTERFVVQPTPNFFNIGTAGGMTKATTGYTFVRVHEALRKMVQSWEKSGKPVLPEQKRDRFWFYDTLLLHIIRYRGRLVKRIMQQLFFKNEMNLILRFLDQKTTLLEEVRLLATLPFWVFMRALAEVYVGLPLQSVSNRLARFFGLSRNALPQHADR